MSDLSLNFAALPNEQPGDDDAREARHQLLASLLGAFADGELPAETASQIDAHLIGCARCRREVDIQVALRERLNREPVPAATAALRDRIGSAVAKLPARPLPVAVAPETVPATREGLFASRRVRVAIIGALAAVALLALGNWTARAINTRLTLGPVASATSAALFVNVVSDYRRVTAGDLPGRARDLAAVRAGVPFPVEPLHAASLSLINAWTADLNGEPAAVLAYRWGDRVLLQYLVAEQQLFRYPAIRESIAHRRVAAANDGAQTLLAWALPSSGAILVGEITPSELSSLRGDVVGR